MSDDDLGEGFAPNPDAPNHGDVLREAEWRLKQQGRRRDMEVLDKVRTVLDEKQPVCALDALRAAMSDLWKPLEVWAPFAKEATSLLVAPDQGVSDELEVILKGVRCQQLTPCAGCLNEWKGGGWE
jgi:hypothetical protein